ncbi:hypothetical protein [Kitasatospora sp. NPDC001683]
MSNWPRIYDLFSQACDAEEEAGRTGTLDGRDGLEDTIEIVGEEYGMDALRQLLTGRSPRA